MRHVTVSRRRSRSRSPILRGPRKVESRTSKAAPVNMLDAATVEKARAGGVKQDKDSSGSGGFKPSERITCTISGDSRTSGGVSNRLSGGSFGRGPFRDGGRFGGERRSFGGPERPFERGNVRDRLSFGDRRRSGGDFGGESRMRSRDEEDERRNGSFRDEDKPVQRLIDPTSVPKSKAYFDHDDRGANGNSKWRGHAPYDPRIDFGPRRGRGGGGGWSGFGGRRGNRYDDNRRSFDRREHNDRPYRPPPSKADGIWTHDKYVELEAEGDHSDHESGGVEIVVDQRSPTKRRVEADD